MHPDRVRIAEHLAVECLLSLEGFCAVVQKGFDLPPFWLGSENETEWGEVELDGIAYDISRPYEPGTLQEWDPSVPERCNFGIILMVSHDSDPTLDADWSASVLVPPFACELAELLRQTVHHHRSWHGVGRSSVPRNRIFRPIRGFVPEEAINYRKIFARGGRNMGDEDFALFKCPRCGRIHLLEYEVETVYLDPDNLSRRVPVYTDTFRCTGCGEFVPADEPWAGPNAAPQFLVTWDELEASPWRWIAQRPRPGGS